jgi:hypothetical protein
MTDVQVQDLFRKAIADDDTAAMSRGLKLLLGLDNSGGGLSAEHEYQLRRPDFVMEMPQSGERIRGRDAMRELQRRFPGGGPSVVLRRVVGAGRVWVVEARNDYQGDVWHVVVIFEFDSDGMIAKETRYYPRAIDAPEWRADLVERMEQS